MRLYWRRWRRRSERGAARQQQRGPATAAGHTLIGCSLIDAPTTTKKTNIQYFPLAAWRINSSLAKFGGFWYHVRVLNFLNLQGGTPSKDLYIQRYQNYYVGISGEQQQENAARTDAVKAVY